MDIVKNLLSVVIGAGIVQSFFLSAALFGIRKGNRRANRLLSILMILFSINIFHAAFLKDLLGGRLPHDSGVYEPFQLLFGPLFYLYVRKLVNINAEFKKREILYFAPFFLYGILVMLPYLSDKTAFFRSPLFPIISPLSWALIIGYMSFFIFSTFKLTKSHEQKIRDNFSSVDKINLNWIKYFLFFFLLINSVDYILLIWMIHGDPFPHFYKIISLALAVMVYGLGYRGLTQPEIFSGEYVPDEAEDDSERAGKYGKSGLTHRESENIIKKLLKFMETEKPYLDADLNLQTLSGRLGIQRNNLSQAINEGLGINFYDFINRYRVEEFKLYLSDPTKRNYKILAIAFESGFNSKPAFNNIFKKFTGMTPSEYKKSIF